jgi:hypothetical protein
MAQKRTRATFRINKVPLRVATDFMNDEANHNCIPKRGHRFVGRFCETPSLWPASDTDALQSGGK